MKDSDLRLFSAKTRDFVSKIYNSTTEVIDNFLKTRANVIKTGSTDTKLYRYENLLLYRANGRVSYNLEQNLKMLENSGLTPKFVQYFELGNDDFLTIMEVCDKDLIPYSEVADKVSETVKQNYVNKVKELYQNRGIINKELLDNQDALLISDDVQQLIYGNWYEIYFLSPEEKESMADFINDWKIQ